VSALTLPVSPDCIGWACSYAVDDIPELTVGTVQIDSSAGYVIAPSQCG